MKARVLVVEDDDAAAAAIGEALGAAGCETVRVADAEAAARVLEREDFDLAVVDVHLPGEDGSALCRRLRARPRRGGIPVLLLSGDGTLETKAGGFAAGADAYLTKPLDGRELALWAEALLRRREGRPGPAPVTAGDIELEAQTRLVRVQGRRVPDLTDKEYGLLALLLAARPGVATRERLARELWNPLASAHSLDVLVGRLREKLGPVGGSQILTVKGVGYRLA